MLLGYLAHGFSEFPMVSFKVCSLQDASQEVPAGPRKFRGVGLVVVDVEIEIETSGIEARNSENDAMKRNDRYWQDRGASKRSIGVLEGILPQDLAQRDRRCTRLVTIPYNARDKPTSRAWSPVYYLVATLGGEPADVTVAMLPFRPPRGFPR